MRSTGRLASWLLLVVVLLSGCARGPKVGEGFIAVPGGRVWYRVVGKGSGTPLLLVHGGPGATSDYLKPLEALGKERPVIFYDQLGCGRSEHPTDPKLWTIERSVRELAAVRDSLHLKRVHLLGHAWGAIIAAEYVLTKPGGVTGLVLASPMFSARTWEADAAMLLETMPDSTREAVARAERSRRYDASDFLQAMRDYDAQFVARRKPRSAELEASTAQLASNIRDLLWGPSELRLTGTLKGFDLTPRLPGIDVPTLFIGGEFDEVRPQTLVQYQYRVTDAVAEVIVGSGHLTMQDEPNAYNDAVRKFLARVEAK